MNGNNQLEIEQFLFIQGNNQQVPVKNEVDNCENLKKVDTKSCSEKKIHRASKEDICSEKQDIPSVEVCTPFFLACWKEQNPFGGLSMPNIRNNCIFHTFERGQFCIWIHIDYW